MGIYYTATYVQIHKYKFTVMKVTNEKKKKKQKLQKKNLRKSKMIFLFIIKIFLTLSLGWWIISLHPLLYRGVENIFFLYYRVKGVIWEGCLRIYTRGWRKNAHEHLWFIQKTLKINIKKKNKNWYINEIIINKKFFLNDVNNYKYFSDNLFNIYSFISMYNNVWNFLENFYRQNNTAEK